MKTIEEWIKTLPEELIIKVMNRIQEYYEGIPYDNILQAKRKSLHEALWDCFPWGSTEEGFIYWDNISNGKF